MIYPRKSNLLILLTYEDTLIYIKHLFDQVNMINTILRNIRNKIFYIFSICTRNQCVEQWERERLVNALLHNSSNS